MADLDFVSSPASAESANLREGQGALTDAGAFGKENQRFEDFFNMIGLGSIAGDRARAHNEAIYDWMRSEQSAATARNWDKMMADTQMQRKLRDYQAAGFSPLAALEGAGAYAGGTSAVGRSSQASGGRGSSAGASIIGGLLKFVSKVAGASIMAQSAEKAAEAKADAWKELATARSSSAEMSEKAHYQSRRGRAVAPAVNKNDGEVTQAELEAALRKAFPEEYKEKH